MHERLAAGEPACRDNDAPSPHVEHRCARPCIETHPARRAVLIQNERDRPMARRKRGAFRREGVSQRHHNALHVTEAVLRQHDSRIHLAVHEGFRIGELRPVIGCQAIRPFGGREEQGLCEIKIIVACSAQLLFARPPCLVNRRIHARILLRSRAGDAHNAVRLVAFAAQQIKFLDHHNGALRLERIHGGRQPRCPRSTHPRQHRRRWAAAPLRLIDQRFRWLCSSPPEDCPAAFPPHMRRGFRPRPIPQRTSLQV